MSLKDLWGAFLQGRFGQFIAKQTVQRVTIGFIFFIIFTFLLSLNFWPERLSLREGQVSPKDIKANKSIEYEDKRATEEARTKAEAAIVPGYEHKAEVSMMVERDIVQAVNSIKSVRSKVDLPLQERVKLLQQNLGFTLDEGIYYNLLQINDEALQRIQDETLTLVGHALDTGIEEDKFETKKQELTQASTTIRGMTPENKAVVKGLIANFLQPNRILDEEATEERRRKAANSVLPVKKSIKQGEIILRTGDIVGPEHIDKLNALGISQPKSPWIAIAGIGLVVVISMGMVLIYLHQYRPDMYLNTSYLLLLGLIVTLTMLVARGILAINFDQWPYLSAQIGYMVPIAAAGMLIAILLDTRLALTTIIFMGLWIGIMTGNQLKFGIVAIVSGMAGVFSVSRLSQRTDLAKAGLLYVSGASAFTIVALGLITETEIRYVFLTAIILGLFNGVLSAVLTGGFLPYLEAAFGLTSAVKLLELANPNNPLLKRMLVEAPGTYHHSIIVGNLAEAAADAIGADTLMTRVGAYYHDIGKTKRPYFFIENQLTMENPHDKIAPSLSTLIITSHIKDGVELAREQKLPQLIVDIIEQHHGTGLVSFFYHRALENDRNETVLESDFRYEGPKPQSREAAVVMLADSVEAAVRAVQRPTMGRIEGLVRKIIKEKLNDGQLDECDLTFKDLDVIANSFVRVLSGIFHTRIEYPDHVLKEIERRKAKDAGARK